MPYHVRSILLLSQTRLASTLESSAIANIGIKLSKRLKVMCINNLRTKTGKHECNAHLRFSFIIGINKAPLPRRVNQYFNATFIQWFDVATLLRRNVAVSCGISKTTLAGHLTQQVIQGFQ